MNSLLVKEKMLKKNKLANQNKAMASNYNNVKYNF